MAHVMSKTVDECLIPTRGARLAAQLVAPAGPPRGAVVIGVLGANTRFISANQFVAASFARAGLTALVVELLLEDEEGEPELPLLAERLCDAAAWLTPMAGAAGEGVGLVGVGAAGAAALVAAAARPELVRAVVCAATAVDLAGTAVVLTQTPTLVLVGDHDRAALLGSRVMPSMHCEHQLEVIRGAGPRLVEPGALDRVVGLATPWLLARLES